MAFRGYIGRYFNKKLGEQSIVQDITGAAVLFKSLQEVNEFAAEHRIDVIAMPVVDIYRRRGPKRKTDTKE